MVIKMKKLNITKDKFTESKYFQTKYGKLTYVSESGDTYKTSKGHVLKFNEDINDEYEDEEPNFSDIELEEDGFAKADSDGNYLWNDESSWLPSSGEKVQFYTEQHRCMYPAMVLYSWVEGNSSYAKVVDLKTGEVSTVQVDISPRDDFVSDIMPMTRQEYMEYLQS